ncbi:BatD family protein [Vibrio sp. F74]|uniref:BatD family protein n=1 Tax=Vibrio sp. F74 TaxID=700020 RepID=UPI0035F594B5
MKSKTNIHILIVTATNLLLLVLSPLSHAAVIASVSSNSMAKGDIFTLKIVSDNRVDSGDVDFTVLDKEFYMGRPSFSSSMNSFNGTRSTRSEWTLSLAPLKAGRLTIPSFQVKGEKTDPISVTSHIDPTVPKSDDFVVYQSQLSKNEIYPGEIAQLDTRLIIKTDARRVQDPLLVPPTALTGLDIEPTGTANRYLSVIDGIEATIIDQSYQITANKAGQHSITSPKFTATILDRNPQTGTTRLVPVDTGSKQIVLRVLDKPTDLVGTWLPSPNLTLSQKWLDSNGNELTNVDEINTTAGSAITREIVIAVEGIAQSQLPNIKVNYPSDIRYYDEQPKIVQEGNQVSMTIKHVLIPKMEGQVNLPSLTLNWWNTVKKQAQTEKLTGLVLAVKPNENPSIKLDSNDNQPTYPAQITTETVVIKEPGIWPFLTILVSVLWLITLGLLLKKKTNNAQNKPVEDKDSDTFANLMTSIKETDGLRAQANMTLWYKENLGIDQMVKAQIDDELRAMIASIYAEETLSWQEGSLITLLKSAKKNLSRKKTEQPSLAPL